MLRRDLLIGSAATAAVSLSPLTLQAQRMETYQENIRRRALSAREVLLCWGQRSGKSNLAADIEADRMCFYREPRCVHVSRYGCWVREREAFRVHEGVVLPFIMVTASPEDFLKHDVYADIVVFDEIDWLGEHPEDYRILMNHARSLRPDLIVASGAPQHEHGSFIHSVQFNAKYPEARPEVLADHATSFEVNPTLKAEDFASDPHFVRDFMAYKTV